MLQPLLFLIYINDLDGAVDESGAVLEKFADNNDFLFKHLKKCVFLIQPTLKSANGKKDEEQTKKTSGFCESLVSSQFLFHQSRYCSLFAPFPSLSHHLVLIMQAKHALFDSEGYKVS